MPNKEKETKKAEPPKFEVEVEGAGNSNDQATGKEEATLEVAVEERLEVVVKPETEELPAVPNELEEKKPKTKGIFLIVLIITLIIVVFIGGILVYKKTVDKIRISAGPEPSPTPVMEPVTPSPKIILKKEDLKIEILNGSGVPGAAGVAKKYLEESGYVITKTGNAKSFTYKETEVSIKEEKEPYLEMLKKDLENKYVLATESSFLDLKNEFDVIILLGRQ